MAFQTSRLAALARWAREPDWEQVCADQLPRIHNFFRYRLGDMVDADDLTLRTFEKAWASRHRYRRDVAGFATWLATIARNVAIDHLRLSESFAPPEPHATHDHDARRLAALLATLPPRHRELIAMRYGAEMTTPAIARATGLSASQVESILSRAVATLHAATQEGGMTAMWMHALRREPSPELRARLRQRLHAAGELAPAQPPRRRSRAWVAAAAVGVSMLLALPPVRASASQFLSLFRVSNFVAVQLDPQRIEQLAARELELGTLIGEHVQVLAGSGPPLRVASLDDAAAAAGMPIALPGWLPNDSRIIETTVSGERVVQVAASAVRLQQIMDALGVHDLSAPAALEGQLVTVRVPPVVMVRYEHGTRRSRLYQARAPQVSLPTAVDLAVLGEIGLRLLGFTPSDARHFAQAIDWHSTLLVPIPPTVSSFRQIDVSGRPGIVFQHQPRNESPTHVVLWSTPDRVFALASIAGLEQVLAMAESVP